MHPLSMECFQTVGNGGEALAGLFVVRERRFVRLEGLTP